MNSDLLRVPPWSASDLAKILSPAQRLIETKKGTANNQRLTTVVLSAKDFTPIYHLCDDEYILQHLHRYCSACAFVNAAWLQSTLPHGAEIWAMWVRCGQDPMKFLHVTLLNAADPRMDSNAALVQFLWA